MRYLITESEQPADHVSLLLTDYHPEPGDPSGRRGIPHHPKRLGQKGRRPRRQVECTLPPYLVRQSKGRLEEDFGLKGGWRSTMGMKRLTGSSGFYSAKAERSSTEFVMFICSNDQVY